MRDKRPVDELSIEELERILAIRKRDARQARLRRYDGGGRRMLPDDPIHDPIDDPIDEVGAESLDKVDVSPARSRSMPVASNTPKPAAKVSPKVSAAKIPETPTPTTYYEGEPRFEDEDGDDAGGGSGHAESTNTARLRKAWLNRILLGVEVTAVVGLIVLVVIVLQSLQAITQTTASLQSDYQATANAKIVQPSATPLINVSVLSSLVLPSGHTYNDDPSQAAFNLDEVPVEYRSQYQSLIDQPVIRPTSSPDGPTRVQIPKLNLDSAVVYGDDWDALKLGVGQHINGVNPGQQGNMVLSAHNDIYNELFRHLDDLAPGDQIIVSTASGKDYHYTVDPIQDRQNQPIGHQLVKPSDVWVLQQPTGGKKMLTLISCYPYRVDSERIVVFASLSS